MGALRALFGAGSFRCTAHSGAEGLDIRITGYLDAGKRRDCLDFRTEIESGEPRLVERHRARGDHSIDGTFQGKMRAGRSAL